MTDRNIGPVDALQVRRWDPQCDGELSESAVRSKLSQLGYDCRLYEYPPGTCFPEHSHAVDKIDAVLGGRLRIRSGSESVILAPGDYVFVPHGLIHSAEVVGDETVISIDGVKTA